MEKSTKAELTFLNSMSMSNLRIRHTTIAVPPGIDDDLSLYFNNSNFIAVRGEKETKVHHCYLVGEIPDSEVPDPAKHIVIEYLYDNINEDLLPDNPKMPSGIPKTVSGFAMLMSEQRPVKAKAAGMSLSVDEYPELSEESSSYFGNSEGGIYTTPSGDTEIVTSSGKSIKMGATLNKDDISIESVSDGFTNWFWWKNIYNDMGLPNVLPLAPITFDPFPNIPGIANLYLKIASFADLLSTMKKIKKILK